MSKYCILVWWTLTRTTLWWLRSQHQLLFYLVCTYHHLPKKERKSSKPATGLLCDVLGQDVWFTGVPSHNFSAFNDLLLKSWCHIPQYIFRTVVQQGLWCVLSIGLNTATSYNVLLSSLTRTGKCRNGCPCFITYFWNFCQCIHLYMLIWALPSEKKNSIETLS